MTYRLLNTVQSCDRCFSVDKYVNFCLHFFHELTLVNTTWQILNQQQLLECVLTSGSHWLQQNIDTKH